MEVTGRKSGDLIFGLFIAITAILNCQVPGKNCAFISIYSIKIDARFTP